MADRGKARGHRGPALRADELHPPFGKVSPQTLSTTGARSRSADAFEEKSLLTESLDGRKSGLRLLIFVASEC